MAIIGADDRELVVDTSRFPYAAVSQVISVFPDGAAFLGSSAMVGPNDVLTAAHVVYNHDHGGWASQVLVTPGLNGDMKPFGAVDAAFLSVPMEWQAEVNFNYDYAVIGLDRAVGYGTGWFSVGYFDRPGSLLGKLMFSIGYPGDRGGETQYYTSGTLDRITGNIFYFHDDLDAAEGQSGSPVTTSAECEADLVVGVMSHHRFFPAENGVVALNQTNFDNITQWIEGNDTGLSEYITTPLYPKDEVGFITRLYTSILDRMPDEEGIRFWLQSRRDGLSMERVAAIFLESDEYVGSGGACEPAAFLTYLYDTVLGRSPDQGGYDWWMGQINNGMDISEVTLGFVNSQEYRRQSAYWEYSVHFSWFESFALDVRGTNDAEILTGSAGSDYIIGCGGDDSLYGGGNSDLLDGGDGNDFISGGDGADFFMTTLKGTGYDVIVDFSVEEDFLLTQGEHVYFSAAENQSGDLVLIRDGDNANLTLTGVSVDDWGSVSFV